MDGATLDLNNPKDARAYIMTWVEDSGPAPSIENGTDEDLLIVAKQLFLFCDPRPAAGSCH